MTDVRPYIHNLRPHHLETLTSYQDRLLTANFETIPHLRNQVAALTGGTPKAKPPQDQVARLFTARTGRDLSRLLTTPRPEAFRLEIPIRHRCRRCTNGATVAQHAHTDSNLCLQHRLWTGPGTTATQQQSVNDDVIRAEIRYQRLRREQRLDWSLFEQIWRQVSGTGTLDTASYSNAVRMLAAITSVAFLATFLNPSLSSTNRHRFLAQTVFEAQGDHAPRLVRMIWLRLRPIVLRLREAIGAGESYDDALRAFPHFLRAAHAIPRHVTVFEAFESHLATSADAPSVEALVDPYDSAQRRDRDTVAMICRRGHRTAIRYVRLRKAAAVGDDPCDVCRHNTLAPGFNDMATLHPHLAKELHPTKNGELTARDLMAGTARRLWWRCANDHEYEATGSNRLANRTGCPFCSNRRVQPGINDLPTTHPRLAEQYNNFRSTQRVTEVSAGSNLNAHWTCPHGHETKAQVGTYVRNGCRSCKRSRHEMLDQRPSLIAEWDFSANEISPYGIPAASRKEAAWVCARGHTWTARIDARAVAGTRCPGCHGKKLMPGVNDLKTAHPELAAEWHPWNNGVLGPEHFTAKSHRDAWWRCAGGHITKEKISQRLERGGCLRCSTATEELASRASA